MNFIISEEEDLGVEFAASRYAVGDLATIWPLTLREDPHGVVPAAVDVGVSCASHVAAVRLAVPIDLASVIPAPALVTVL